MYNDHFGFHTEPFGVSPDPAFFFRSVRHQEAISALQYAIAQRRGFAALTAPPGLGKTTVISSLLASSGSNIHPVVLVYPTLAAETIIEAVLTSMNVEPALEPAARIRQLGDSLTSLDRANRTCVVILDEAQNLPVGALETIRMLSNFETMSRKLIQFVLVGQPSLETVLNRPECEQIRQRVNVVARLAPLSKNEVVEYCRHRLRVAGAVRQVFTAQAIDVIFRISEGVPRVINTIAFLALTLAYAQGRREVSPDLIEKAADDMMLQRCAPICMRTEVPEPAPVILPMAESRNSSTAGQRFGLMCLLLTIFARLARQKRLSGDAAAMRTTGATA